MKKGLRASTSTI